jgi:predicted signal transduction protein with EAL and GGDEF domain
MRDLMRLFRRQGNAHRLHGWAQIAAALLAPIVASMWASRVAPAKFAIPLVVAAAAIQLLAVRRYRAAERMAHALTGGGKAVAPLETSLANIAKRLEAIGHRAKPAHPISGLPTREHLFAAMAGHVAADDGPRMLATFRFVDLDRIAAFDHAAAHTALADLAERLATAAHRRHVIVQVDRDCFAVWFAGQPDAAAADAELRVLTHLMAQELPSGDRFLSPAIEVGCAHYPADGDSPVVLLNRALSTRARPEFSKSGAVTLPPAESLKDAREAFVLEQDLAQAIAAEQLTMLFQPLVDISQRRVVGAEALLRWQHPTMGAVSPARFIPIVEQIGLSDQFGSWVLNTACREMRRWREAGLGGLRVAVNLSACQLADPALREKIERTLARHHLEPATLELELTETAAMADAARTLHLFQQLHELGISLAIDDFGSGHSSLSYLKNLPFDKLKIDREFVADIHEQPDSQAICKALIELGRGLGLSVLAEGVECRSEVDQLARLGCTLFQGYFFSRPLATADFMAFARDPSGIPGLQTPVHAHLSRIESRLSA